MGLWGVFKSIFMDRSFLRQAWAAHGALNKNSRWVHPENGWKSPWVSVVKYVLYTDPRAMRCLECLECLKTGDVFSMGASHLRSLSHRFWSFPEWGMLRLLIFDKETNGEKGHPKFEKSYTRSLGDIVVNPMIHLPNDLPERGDNLMKANPQHFEKPTDSTLWEFKKLLI